MRAVVYQGPGDIRLEEVPEPVIQDPEDAIVRVTTTSICGSDTPHPARSAAQDGAGQDHRPRVRGCGARGRLGGHAGSSRATGWSARRRCGAAAAGPAGAACSAPASAGRPSATARCWATCPAPRPTTSGCPSPTTRCSRSPAAADEQVIFAGDILPTGYSAVAGLDPGGRGVEAGDNVVVFGAGPVGLCAVASARLFEPAKVIAVDIEPERLAMAEQAGRRRGRRCRPPRMSARGSRQLTDGWGADYVVEAVGKQESLGQRRGGGGSGRRGLGGGRLPAARRRSSPSHAGQERDA